MPSTEQDLACWLDDRQTELRDALDMADMESASAITSLITRGLAKMASFVPPTLHSRTWCREESDKVGIQGHESGRGVPSRLTVSQVRR